MAHEGGETLFVFAHEFHNKNGRNKVNMEIINVKHIYLNVMLMGIIRSLQSYSLTLYIPFEGRVMQFILLRTTTAYINYPKILITIDFCAFKHIPII